MNIRSLLEKAGLAEERPHNELMRKRKQETQKALQEIVKIRREAGHSWEIDIEDALEVIATNYATVMSNVRSHLIDSEGKNTPGEDFKTIDQFIDSIRPLFPAEVREQSFDSLSTIAIQRSLMSQNKDVHKLAYFFRELRRTRGYPNEAK